MIELARDDLDVGLIAFNAEAMITFYGEVLALPSDGTMKIPGIGLMHRYKIGTQLLKVTVPNERPAAPVVVKLPWQAGGMRYWTIHVVDLEAVLAGLAAHGVTSVTGILDPRPGVRYAIVVDPDGNGIEFVEGA
jgi:catechol 2,3-dioxygenase-like lactoylglutathione lyase family enzyme